ncbi:hypothetical protein [Formosa sp. A9]|uniref:hypothetical protein n=1 Tax=Formosa sp. A9 TaxID=3442641 RepID=UPI003EBA952A
MKEEEILELKAQLNSKIVKGDYIVLGQLLDLDSHAARMRFKRGKEDAVTGMKEIVENREALIESFKSKQLVRTINGLPEGFAVLDLVVAKSGRLLVVLITNKKNHHIVYDSLEEMDAKAFLFVKDILKTDKVKYLITDCSLGYLPNILEIIKEYNVEQFYNHPFAHRSEAILQILSKKN